MRLALSAEAAPALPLADLLQSCGHRGLEAVELVAGADHRVELGLDAARLADLLWEVRASGLRVTGLYLADDAAPDWGAAARLAAALEVPAVAPAALVEAGRLDEVVGTFREAGARLLLAHRTTLDATASACELIRTAGADVVGLAWEVNPAEEDLAQLPAVLQCAGERLEYIRFQGGGPESEQNTGRGIGAFMARLTLAGYGGPLVIHPSNPTYHYAWRAWLGRAGGWGCGSKSADASLVSLGTHA